MGGEWRHTKSSVIQTVGVYHPVNRRDRGSTCYIPHYLLPCICPRFTTQTWKQKARSLFLVLCSFSCVHPHVVGYLSPNFDFVAKNAFTYHYWQQDRLVMSFLRVWHTAFALFSSGVCVICPVCTFGCTEPRTWHTWVTNVSVVNVSVASVSDTRHSPVLVTYVTHQCQWHGSFTSVSDTRHSPVLVTHVTHQCQWHASFTSVIETRLSSVSVTRFTHQCQWHALFTSVSDTRHSSLSVTRVSHQYQWHASLTSASAFLNLTFR